MSAEEREVKQRMTAYARQSLARDARLLDLRFEAGTSSWLASAVSKANGVLEIVAVKEQGQWRLSSSQATKSVQRALIGTRIEKQSLGKLFGKLVVVAIFAGLGYLALPYAHGALKQLPMAGVGVPAAKPQQGTNGSLNSRMLDAATDLANDPARKAAMEKAAGKLLGNQELGKLHQP